MLVFGGSLGARSINEAAIEAFDGAAFRVLHACGARDYPALRDRVPGPSYDLREYIDPFGDALAASDLCVARAGGSIFEVAAHGRPAVLVPYPHASADHQSKNARWMADAGAAVVIPDSELTPARLAHEVAELLADPSRLAAMGEASAQLARPDAAQRIAGEILAAARRAMSAEQPWSGRRLHLIGIGGAGMSAYARAAVALGAQVSGSDGAPGPAAAALAEIGVEVRSGHAAGHLPAGDDVEVFYSSAIRADNPERVAARERGLAEHPRARLLAELSALRRTIAVAGAHGKTTTTSMVAHVLLACGLEPGLPVGGELRSTGPQRRLGDRRVARGRGRRVGPLDAVARGRDRGGHERRARPPRDVRLAGRAARGLPGVPRVPAAGRPLGPAGDRRAAGASDRR